ncbi:MAG: hypothetical protein KDD64_02670 [Bdellovibrionales bacterium]|nr:hypothetical protein [Bdellovibrionales bacterium]
MRALITTIVVAVVALLGLFIFPLIFETQRPPMVERVEEIALNETAFMVPLTGDQTKQGQFANAEALEANKVFGLRVTLPQRKRDTGRISFSWEPSVELVRVERAPVYALWSDDPFNSRDQSGARDALQVQDNGGIKFAVPLTVAAMILPEDAATFQSVYRGKSLRDVLDSDVFNYAQTDLSARFEAVPLMVAREKKGEFVRATEGTTTTFFKDRGVTILYLGLYEGLIYRDPQIQRRIDEEYVRQLQARALAFSRTAQQTRNETNVLDANIRREIAGLYEESKDAFVLSRQIAIAEEGADIIVQAASVWKGGLPSKVLGGGGSEDTSLLINVPAETSPSGNR